MLGMGPEARDALLKTYSPAGLPNILTKTKKKAGNCFQFDVRVYGDKVDLMPKGSEASKFYANCM